MIDQRQSARGKTFHTTTTITKKLLLNRNLHSASEIYILLKTFKMFPNKVFKGWKYSREETIWENTVFVIVVVVRKKNSLSDRHWSIILTQKLFSIFSEQNLVFWPNVYGCILGVACQYSVTYVFFSVGLWNLI